MDTATTEFKLEKKSVNSKVLCEQVQKQIEDLIVGAGVVWSSDSQREDFVGTIDEIMAGFQDTDKIEQWNCMCDLRNNTIAQMDHGTYIVEVSYKQKNCLNTTRLIYTVKDLLIASLKELLDVHQTP